MNETTTNTPPVETRAAGGRWALIGISLLCLVGSGAALLLGHRPVPPPIVITSPGGAASQNAPPPAPVPPARPSATPAPRLYVHVAGAVRKPSLYALPAQSRIMAAITAAGGPTPKADLDAVNLAEKVQDGEKVYVPEKHQAEVVPVPPGNALGHESVAPPPALPANQMAPAKVSALPTGKPAKTGVRGGASKADKLSSPSEGQIALNTATAEQMERLPGVGPAMAARILAYRQQAGGFRKIDDLMEVRGVGVKKFAKMEPFVRL